MLGAKMYYGTRFLRKEGISNIHSSNKIMLNYYKITNRNLTEQTKKYGIEIRKKEYKNNNVEIETRNINNISESSKKVINIIETLKKYKVTPIGLQDVVEDLLKQSKE